MTEEQKASLDLDDIFPSILQSLSDPETGDIYALPFFGESSFIMYNTELFEQAGLTMPEEPTWDDIYDLAVALDDDEAGITGITMRGAPGWGMSGAPFVTICNAMGAQFYDMDWNATIDTPEMRSAWEMYKKLLRDAGQDDIITYTYNECISLMTSGKCGMYYDATSNAPNLEAADSAIKGKVDPLIGLKENVLIGKLIPAGTGMRRYRGTRLNTDVHPECEVRLEEDDVVLSDTSMEYEDEAPVESEDFTESEEASVIGLVEE